MNFIPVESQCFPKMEVEGNIEIRGKQNSLVFRWNSDLLYSKTKVQYDSFFSNVFKLTSHCLHQFQTALFRSAILFEIDR